VVEKKNNSNLPFVTILITVLPVKISSEKKVSKLRSIAKHRAFDGIESYFVKYLRLLVCLDSQQWSKRCLLVSSCFLKSLPSLQSDKGPTLEISY
jgi:hypothetical protein